MFLHRLVQVLIGYFKELEEESIRDNFVIIYELMDEMMDFGYPQTTESKILQEYVSHISLFPFLVRAQDAPRARVGQAGGMPACLLLFLYQDWRRRAVNWGAEPVYAQFPV